GGIRFFQELGGVHISDSNEIGNQGIGMGGSGDGEWKKFSSPCLPLAHSPTLLLSVFSVDNSTEEWWAQPTLRKNGSKIAL
ncbi:MAG: hypothetical protein ACKVT0_22715, partial [Planctomycetaceae bacterium]